MATGRSSFAKRQRDMAKKARAEAKRQKRLGRNVNPFDTDNTDNTDANNNSASTKPGLSNSEIITKMEQLHKLYDDGLLDLDTFDEKKTSLMSQISV